MKQTKWQDIEGRFNLAGVQYSDYQLVCVRLKAGTVVQLIGEPHNKYDNKAIRVEYKGIKLGYVPSHSIHQSEIWNAHSRGFKIIGVVTAFNKTNPTWMMITLQAKRTTLSKTNKTFDVPMDK